MWWRIESSDFKDALGTGMLCITPPGIMSVSPFASVWHRSLAEALVYIRNSFNLLETHPFLIEHSIWMLKMSEGIFATVKASFIGLRGVLLRLQISPRRRGWERSFYTILWTEWELHLLKRFVLCPSAWNLRLLFTSPPHPKSNAKFLSSLSWRPNSSMTGF